MGKSIFGRGTIIESGWRWSPIQWGWHTWKMDVLDYTLDVKGKVKFILRGPYWATIYREHE